jgi:hypothetical protein
MLLRSLAYHTKNQLTSHCPSFSRRMLHHLMVGTWTPPGAIFTFEFDDVALSLRLIKRTPIPEDEPISWMTFDVSFYLKSYVRVVWLIFFRL